MDWQNIESWHWIPGHSVGPFRFGDNLEAVSAFGLTKVSAHYPEADWESYRVAECRSRITIEEGRIVEVLCKDGLEYQGNNVLGKPLDEVRRIFGSEEHFDAGEVCGLTYPRLGLIVWAHDGVVNGASCSPVRD